MVGTQVRMGLYGGYSSSNVGGRWKADVEVFVRVLPTQRRVRWVHERLHCHVLQETRLNLMVARQPGLDGAVAVARFGVRRLDCLKRDGLADRESSGPARSSALASRR